MKKCNPDEAPLFVLDYDVDDAAYDDAYRVYLSTERRSEKRYALLAIPAIIAVTAIVTAVIGVEPQILMVGVLLVIFMLSYQLIPTNRRFMKNQQLLYGEHHHLAVYADRMEMTEQLDTDTDEEYDDENGCFLVYREVGVYETDTLFLIYRDNLRTFFEPVPKAALAEDARATLRDHLTACCGKRYVRPALHEKEGKP